MGVQPSRGAVTPWVTSVATLDSRLSMQKLGRIHGADSRVQPPALVCGGQGLGSSSLFYQSFSSMTYTTEVIMGLGLLVATSSLSLYTQSR